MTLPIMKKKLIFKLFHFYSSTYASEILGYILNESLMFAVYIFAAFPSLYDQVREKFIT